MSTPGMHMPSTSAYQAAISGNDAAILARATQMAALTGRDMREWMPPPQEVTTPSCCLNCNWSGFDAVETGEGERYCPQCGDFLEY